MGSSSSRLGSPPPRTPRAHRFKRTLSSLFLCGSSTSHAPIETDDDPAELLVNSSQHSDPVVDDFQIPAIDSALTSSSGTGFTSPKAENGASSRTSKAASEDFSSEDGSTKVETGNRGKCVSENKELAPLHLLNSESASTSYENRSSLDPVSASERTDINVIDGAHNVTNKGVSQTGSEDTHQGFSSPHEPRDSIPDGNFFGNRVTEVTDNQDSGSNSVSLGNHSLLVSDRDRGERDASLLHVDLVSISSDTSSTSSIAEISSREARPNSRRLFWDAFSRRGSRRRSDSRTFLFSTDDIDDLGSRDRWLLDFSGDFFDDGVGGDSGYLGSRTRGMSERRQESRSEIRERLRGGLDGRNRRTSFCPSGLHRDGSCSCESILMGEDSSTRASISRIVMLAEALFEVLDEIHRQPLSLSLSMVSLPAPESIVDSFPVKNHRKPDSSESGDDVAQCYICLAEYEEGDKIRVLPCHHEYHMLCVDKWLKEIHGVCPLCRGDVREGFTEASASNSEVSSN